MSNLSYSRFALARRTQPMVLSSRQQGDPSPRRELISFAWAQVYNVASVCLQKSAALARSKHLI